MKTALVTGATGFIGRNLAPALARRGLRVIAASRNPPGPDGRRRNERLHDAPAPAAGERDAQETIEWCRCDLLDPETLPAAFAGVDVAYYLVHSMAGGRADFRRLERRSAHHFAAAAARAGVERIVYLGGPQPAGPVSEHLRSRLAVGEILRASLVPTIELRASMVIGSGGASWQIVRDLAVRLPVMVLPRWLSSRTRPIALDDVIDALVAAADVPLPRSTWFDIAGPETLTGRQILERIDAIRGRTLIAFDVPLLTPRLSSLWLKLVTRTDFGLARELVDGLTHDLLPTNDQLWDLIGHPPQVSFDEAVRRALAQDAERPRFTDRFRRTRSTHAGASRCRTV